LLYFAWAISRAVIIIIIIIIIIFIIIIIINFLFTGTKEKAIILLIYSQTEWIQTHCSLIKIAPTRDMSAQLSNLAS